MDKATRHKTKKKLSSTLEKKERNEKPSIIAIKKKEKSEKKASFFPSFGLTYLRNEVEELLDKLESQNDRSTCWEARLGRAFQVRSLEV